MSKVPVHQLPASVVALVEQLIAAGFTFVSATAGNGRWDLCKEGEPTVSAQEAFRSDLAAVAHGINADHVLDITAVRLTRRQSFEDVEIKFTPAGLTAAEQAESTPVAHTLPAHMPKTCRAGAEAVLALGYKPHGHLTFTKGDHSSRTPQGVSVQFSWIP